MTWQSALYTSRYRWALIFCLATLLMMVFYMPTFYHEIIRPKESILIYDPILDFLTPIDWSLPIFGLLYLTTLQSIYSTIDKPVLFMTALLSYCIISILRMGTIYFITLEPPGDMILLIDPVTTFLVYPDSGFAKDLFFSGHVSTMFILVLVEKNKVAKALKISATTLVGVMLAWQHVHYTIDLIAAPLITYLIYLMVNRLLKVDPRESAV